MQHRAGLWSGVVLSVILGTACSGSRASRAPAAGGNTPADLVVHRGDSHGRFLLTGELKAVKSDDIVVPRTPSWQIQIRWMETDGAAVVAGQRVLELDNSSFAGTLEERRLTEVQAENALVKQEAEAEATEAEASFQLEERRTALEKAKIEAAVPAELRSGRDYQEKQLALHRAQAEFDKARETLEARRGAAQEDLGIRRIELEKARREVAVAEQAIGALTLSAPRSGILVINDHPWEGRKFQVGDTTWVGLAVMSIPDLREMEVEAKLSDVDDGRIAAGMPAVCTVDAYPDLPFRGVVREITPIAQEMAGPSQRRAFRVVVSLERSDAERMRPGMSVKVEIEARRVKGALLAPRAALDLASDPPRALLRNGHDVPVRLGACEALQCVVEEGLEEGTLLRSRG